MTCSGRKREEGKSGQAVVSVSICLCITMHHTIAFTKASTAIGRFGSNPRTKDMTRSGPEEPEVAFRPGSTDTSRTVPPTLNSQPASQSASQLQRFTRRCKVVGSSSMHFWSRSANDACFYAARVVVLLLHRCFLLTPSRLAASQTSLSLRAQCSATRRSALARFARSRLR